MPFAELCEAAYKQRVPLFAQGFYRTPDIHFDPQTGRGRPFHYFAYGAAVSEVEMDGFTGDYRLLRTDILQDVGDSVAPIIDRGQIEGGFIQGVGWLTIEELLWDDAGRVATAGASTYKLPSWSEVPEIVRGHVPAARDAARRGLRQQGRRRAAADAGDLGARGAARRGGGVCRRFDGARARCRSPSTVPPRRNVFSLPCSGLARPARDAWRATLRQPSRDIVRPERAWARRVRGGDRLGLRAFAVGGGARVATRPFASLDALHAAMVAVDVAATSAEQLALLARASRSGRRAEDERGVGG